MEQPKSTNAGGSTILSGQTATQGFAGPVLHTERLKLVPIRPCDYEPYRAFIMSANVTRTVRHDKSPIGLVITGADRNKF